MEAATSSPPRNVEVIEAMVPMVPEILQKKIREIQFVNKQTADVNKKCKQINTFFFCLHFFVYKM